MPSWSRRTGAVLDHLPGGKLLLRHAAGAADSAAAPIFMFHRVLPHIRDAYDPEMAVSVEAMDSFLAWLVRTYEPLPLEELERKLQSGSPRPPCAVTFDDGWVDTFAHAFPLLQRWQVPATVFLPVQFIGTDRRFWQEKLHFHLCRLRDDPQGWEKLNEVGRNFAWCAELSRADLESGRLHRLLMRRASEEAEDFVARLGDAAGVSLELVGRAFMNWDEVGTMQRAGIAFGSHTLDHTLLANAAPRASAHALRQSRIALQEQLDSPIATLAYPWGEPGPFGRRQAQQAGYGWAVTTRPGFVRKGADPLLWPRIPVSNAQLGWVGGRGARTDGVGWEPATLQVHMARARRRPQPAPALLTPEGKLRLGIFVDDHAYEAAGLRGGSETQQRHILDALHPDDFELEFYFLHEPVQGMPRDYPGACFAAAPAGSGRLAILTGLRRLLARRQPALAQAMFQDSYFLGVPAAWLARVPAVLCARRNAGHWKRGHHRLALRLVNLMTTSWQTNSPAVATLLHIDEGVPKPAIEILPNWIDLHLVAPASPQQRAAARERLGLAPDRFVVLAVANYTPVKNLATLLAAAGRLAASVPHCAFFLVGSGPEEQALQLQAQALGLGPSVNMAGAQTHIQDFLAAADVGVLTSLSEGCSNAVLEYMAAGLPTVLSDIPANRMLTRVGLFPVGDPAALERELLALARDPTLRQFRGRENRQRAEAYGSGDFAERVQAHYVRAMRYARSPRRPAAPTA